MLSHLHLVVLSILAVAITSQSILDVGFDPESGVRVCGVIRGSLAASIEEALGNCKSLDDCDHGTRCIPCKMPLSGECDVDGMTTMCEYSSMCDTTTDSYPKKRKWQLRRNIIITNHPTKSVENPLASHD